MNSEDYCFDEFDVLGNLYSVPITITLGVSNNSYSEDKYASLNESPIEETFASVEHLYQAFKFISTTDIFQNRYAKLIQQIESSSEARYLGEEDTPYIIENIDPTQNIDIEIDDSLTKHMNDFRHKVSPVENWDEKREEVMLMCLLAKFTQNQECANALLSTGNASLHLTPNFPKNATLSEKKEIMKSSGKESDYWSSGIASLGKDRLGALLMQVREELQLKEQLTRIPFPT